MSLLILLRLLRVLLVSCHGWQVNKKFGIPVVYLEGADGAHNLPRGKNEKKNSIAVVESAVVDANAGWTPVYSEATTGSSTTTVPVSSGSPSLGVPD